MKRNLVTVLLASSVLAISACQSSDNDHRLVGQLESHLDAQRAANDAFAAAAVHHLDT